MVSQKVTPSPELTGFSGEMIVVGRSARESTVKDIVPENRMQDLETFPENHQTVIGRFGFRGSKKD